MKSHICSVLTLLACSGAVLPAYAQDAPQAIQPETQPETQPAQTPGMGSAASADRVRLTLTDELPWLLRRAALLDLRLQESPSPGDYELASYLLEMGLALSPDDAELARDFAQAAWLAGDEARMLAATRQVIRMDPGDTVAQLRLISARINQEQTIEGRKALYDRFLGEGGVSLDPSVRSRLALDAALLEREAGNTTAFIERLHQATRLDPSNKAAASLAAQFYASVRDDKSVWMDYKIRLLMADPLDPNLHLSIAQMLSGEGALAASERFLQNANDLYALETGEESSSIREMRLALEWQVYGADKPIGPLNAELNDSRAAAQARIDAYIEAQLPTDSLPDPLGIRYTLGINKLRILAAHAEKEEELVRSVLNDIEAIILGEIAQIVQMASAPGANANALLPQVVVRMLDLNTMRAIVGLDAEKIREELAALQEQVPSAAAQFAQVEPMALFAEGRFEEYLAATEGFEGNKAFALIRAQCFEAIGRTDEAVDLYTQIAHSSSLDAFGAFSHTRLQQLDAADRVLTDEGRAMAQIVDRVPDWVERMIERPSSYQVLSIEHADRIYHEGERPKITIKLQNTAPIPLSVGPNAPISTRMLVEPVGVATQSNNFVGTPRAKVVQMDTRLRLMPRESLSVTVYADSVSTDWLIEQQPGVSMRERWRVIQGFRVRLADEAAKQQQARSGQPVFGIINSPLGLTAETRVVQRLGLRTARADASELISLLAGPDRDGHRRAVTAIGARLINPLDGGFSEPKLEGIVAALNDLYTRSDEPTRAAMMLALPQRHQHPAMIGFDDHVVSLLLSDSLIESRVDPVTLACALLTRTDAQDSPVFETLANVSDPSVHRIAEIARSRLQSGLPILGTVGPGVEAMTPSFDGLED